jgi:hypothetical protein
MSKPVITYRVGRQEYRLPLDRAVWVLWCALTYPLCILAAYLLLGTNAAIFTVILFVLTNRGKI